MTKTELNIYLNDLSEAVSQTSDMKQLKLHSEMVRQRYRDKTSSGRDLEIQEQGEAEAYLAWRWPVTAMVIHEVLGRLKEAWPEFSPQSVLDLGAGPAVSVLPTVLQFPMIKDYILWEEQSAMIQAGELMLSRMKGTFPQITASRWQKGDFLTGDWPATDLILASYAVNELNQSESKRLCKALAASAAQVVVLIVPGTPEHFKGLTAMRNRLVDEGYSILAPCTFTGPCPMEHDNWCHFFLRVQRSKLLRQLKSAELSYEDEKFSYLILRKNEGFNQDARSKDNPHDNKNEVRIIRHPIINKGYRQVSLCGDGKIREVRFTKGRHKAIYRTLKRKSWGDLLDISSLSGNQ